jgi:hypothetical protein
MLPVSFRGEIDPTKLVLIPKIMRACVVIGQKTPQYKSSYQVELKQKVLD